MSVELHTHFSKVDRRSCAHVALEEVMTGRWVKPISSSTITPVVAATDVGVYLVLEGSRTHTGGATDFTGGVSTKFTQLPSEGPTGQIALCYGVFRATVGPAGFDISDSANIVVGAKMRLLAALTGIQGARLTTLGSGTIVAIVEDVTRDVSSNILTATIRTLAA